MLRLRANAFRKCLLVWTSVSLLPLTATATSSEADARQLYDRAKQLSDIRSDGAQPFQLKARFTVYSDSKPSEGTYTEIWSSESQWRRETVLADFRRIQVGNGNKRWILDSSATVPGRADESEKVLRFWSLQQVQRHYPIMEERSVAERVLQCIETKVGVSGGRSALCFDPVIGTLAARVLPVELLDRIADDTCWFGAYHKFGEKLFPRKIHCAEDGKPTLDVDVVELSSAEQSDATLFRKPDGAHETINCEGLPHPPKPIYTVDPQLPRRETPQHPVILQVTVGEDGKPQDITVTLSVDKAFDQAAVDAVRQWRFAPGTCHGEPVETKVNVDVVFRVR